MRPRKIILCVGLNETTVGVRRFLLETRGYRVIGVVGAADAIEAVNASLPDLVLTDLVLPGMDGNELARHLKNIARFVPVILSSPYARPLSEHHADAFLSNGTSSAELLERIRILLIRKRGPRKVSHCFQVAALTEKRTA